MAKRRIIWSARAKRDLINILNFYYKRNGTKTFSRKLNAIFRNSIRLLEKHPEIGIRTDVKNIRNLIVSDFGIFYEIKPKTIEIITIWDSRQNPVKLEIKK
jgi:plasmid stabilization system protein ParE